VSKCRARAQVSRTSYTTRDAHNSAMLGPSHPDTNECTVMQTVFLEDDARSRKTVDCDAKTARLRPPPPPRHPGARDAAGGGLSHRCRLVLACLVGRAASFGFTVPAGLVECFHESAKASERLSGEWKVLKGGMMDLDVQACRRSHRFGRRHPRAVAAVHTLHPCYTPGDEPIGRPRLRCREGDGGLVCLLHDQRRQV
jgi:hypothetical protein